MKNIKELSVKEMQQINGGGLWYYVGMAVEKACESFTHIYG